MNFDFSDDQKLLRDQARKFLFDKCDRKSVRTILDDDQLHYHKELWSQISEMGWTGTAIPEEYGGLGLGMLELCVIAEELGRSLAPTPFSSSIYLFAEFIKNYGSEDQKKKFLPSIASGEKIGSFALSETNGTPKPSNVKTKFSSGKINGYKSPVSDGESADFLIIAANSDDKGNRNSLSLYIVDLNENGVNKTSLETIDPTRPACSINFENVEAELLGEQGVAWDMTENILNRAAVLYSFEQVGGAQVSLDEAKKYSKKLINLQPEYPQTYIACLVVEENKKKGIPLKRKLMELQPNFTPAMIKNFHTWIRDDQASKIIDVLKFHLG